MIVRLVKMQLREDAVDAFAAMFAARRARIAGFPGCLHLELWHDAAGAPVFYTYSHWESEAALNHYRFSEFFKETWTLTKTFFAAKAEAVTLVRAA